MTRLFTVLRLDGRNWTKRTAELTKPFDPALTDALIQSAAALMNNIGAPLAYVQSDEVTIAIPNDAGFFGHRPDKITSVTAGLLSAEVTLRMLQVLHFDCRIVGASLAPQDVEAAIEERVLDATRNAANSFVHHTMPMLESVGMSTKERLRRAKEAGHDIDTVDVRNRAGVLLHDVWQQEDREYTDGRTDEVGTATVWRRHTDVTPIHDLDIAARNRITGTTLARRIDLP